MLKLLGCEHDRAAVQQRARRLEGGETRGRGGRRRVWSSPRAARSPNGTPSARPGGGALPLFSIERIGDAPAKPLPAGERPLAGIKVLDLTRVIAGPVCGRTLAAHGADVLLVTAPHLPSMRAARHRHRPRQTVDVDRSARAKRPRDARRRCIRDADIFVQGYRPGAIAEYGFGAEDAARIRPGIVYVSLCAYGHDGPWAGRRGFDSLVQTANGLNVAEAEAAGEEQAASVTRQELDHATGYLLAFGAMTALERRATKAAAGTCACSLAQTGHWLRELGRVEGGMNCPDPRSDDVRDSWRRARPALADSPACVMPAA